MLSLVAKLEIVALPLSIRISDCSKLDTDSVNVIVNLNGPFVTYDVDVAVERLLFVEKLTLGRVVSSIVTVTLCDVAAVLALFAASVATFAVTPIVTVPLAVGVIVAV